VSDYDKWYAALKAVEPEAYFKAIQYAEGVTLKFNLPEKAAVECERSHVMLACELLGIRP
jgi:hypothetical protein